MNQGSIIGKEMCGFKNRFNSLENTKGKNFANGRAIKHLFFDYGVEFKLTDVETVIKDYIPDSLFQTERELNLNNQLLAQKLMRLSTYLHSLTSRSLESGGEVDLPTITESISAKYHFAIKSTTSKEVTICYIKNKKKDLKAGGKSTFTRIDKSMELFLLQKIGEYIYPSFSVKAAIFYLSSVKDTSGLVDASFEAKYQIADYSFYGHEYDTMQKRLEDLLLKSDENFPCLGKCADCYYQTLCAYTENDTTAALVSTAPKAPAKVTFTESQEEFMNFKHGICRVLAGAGSGKTTCLANRIINLLLDGYKPKDILLITYTTKGVEEIKEKLNYWLHFNFLELDYPLEDFQIFTFNGFGNFLIKQEYKLFGFTEEPHVLDKYENMRIIKQLLDKNPEIPTLNYSNPFMNYFNSKGCVLQMESWFKIIKQNEIVYPQDLQDICKISEVVAEETLKLYKEYESYYKANNFLDFNDQLNMLYELYKDYDMRETYGFAHIMCDEFQDSDNLQIAILKEMIKYQYTESFVVVGDDSQAIYSWRGATSENIIRFNEIFSDTIDINMMENFRSTKPICDLANKINDINTRKVKKYLSSETDGDYVTIKDGDSVEEFVQIIKADIKLGIPLSEMAIINRNKKELLEIQQLLSKDGISSELAVSELLIDNLKVQMMSKFSSFLADTNLTLGLAEYCKLTDFENFQNNLSNLESYLNSKKDEILDEVKATPARNRDTAKYFYYLNKLAELSKEDRSLSKMYEVLCERKFTSRTIQELSIFLNEMAIYQADYYVEKDITRKDAIILTTAHSSKGREFNNVYIYLNKFKYPKYYNAYAPEKNTWVVEEERRLLFVAITRAKNRLLLFGDKYSEIYKEVAEANRKIIL